MRFLNETKVILEVLVSCARLPLGPVYWLWKCLGLRGDKEIAASCAVNVDFLSGGRDGL